MFLLQPSCSVFGDDILLCYCDSFTPQTAQLNISTFITETGPVFTELCYMFYPSSDKAVTNT